MTTIQFYHLRSTTRERAVPKLMEKALESGAKVLLLAKHPATLKILSDAMWTNDPTAFIPHGFAKEPHADEQPIIMTLTDQNPNQATILCLLDGASADNFSSYQKILDVFDGNNEDEVASARIRWSHYKEQGYALQYVKQQTGGGWKIEMSIDARPH